MMFAQIFVTYCTFFLLLTSMLSEINAHDGVTSNQIDDGDGLSFSSSLSGESGTMSSTSFPATTLVALLERVKRQDPPRGPPEDLTTARGLSSEENNEVVKEDENSDDLCHAGLIVPLWMPQTNVLWSDRIVRGLVYFFILCYLFMGVSIVSDRFMGAIEEITSQERNVIANTRTGEKTVITVRVWNETVANLTLMALGSSAPEILLSIIEMFAKNFEAGDLGPGTIVGSAAFNLFVIIGICIVVIPSGEVRRIKHLRVFIVTATFSIFAYLWLYYILAVQSPGRVTVLESVITFLFFPVLVLWAYVAERRLLLYKYIDKCYCLNKRGVIVSSERVSSPKMRRESSERDYDAEYNIEFEFARHEYLVLLTEFRKRYPDVDIEELEIMAQEQMITRGPKSQAFYRIQATRKMIGSGNIRRKIRERAQRESLAEVKSHVRYEDYEDDEDAPSRIFFEPGHYTVIENCGEFEVCVVRSGDLASYTTVDYETENGSAVAGTDFVNKKGTITFPPGIDEQRFKIEIIDDDIFEEDVCFYIRLSNPSGRAILSVPKLATVMILDDDHCGIFGFSAAQFECSESIGIFELKVTRFSGARGRVVVPYWTEDGTARVNKDYQENQGELVFENNEFFNYIPIIIFEESSYEKNVTMYVTLGTPQLSIDQEVFGLMEATLKKPPDELTVKEKILIMGQPKLGENFRVEIRIRENLQFRRTVDKLVQTPTTSAVVGSNSWKAQFYEAMTVIPGDETDFSNDDNLDDNRHVPTWIDYIVHFLIFFWKLLFAFIPPTKLYGGYLTFVVSILCIGFLTAIIGDMATYFGCSLGIKDSVTAICFVALGTSIPDTFASKIAALTDETADNSIGNVTGSNAVNVFIGIGCAWSISSIYHAHRGDPFVVQPGAIGFAVAVFCIEAIFAIAVLMFRRTKAIGGELGGPTSAKYICGAGFILLWLLYVLISTLQAYGLIRY